jgi:phage-related protein
MAIPAQRFKFTDNQATVPTTNFYSVSDSQVLNGVIPGSNVAMSNLPQLMGTLNTQAPSSNLLTSAINGVSSVGSTIMGGVSSAESMGSSLITDASSVVQNALGGVGNVVSTIFGDIANLVPGLSSLTPGCLNNLFNGNMGYFPNGGNGCGGLNSGCGTNAIGGIIGGLMGDVSLATSMLSNLSNPLIGLLQSNFLGNLVGSALSGFCVNDVYSTMMNAQNSVLSLPVQLGAGSNILRGISNNTQSVGLLDFGNIGAGVAGVSSLGSMVPSVISSFTNNYSPVGGPVYNMNAGSNTGYTPINTSATTMSNSFSAISPNWNTSSVDSSTPSIGALVDNNSNNNLTNTTVYSSYQKQVTTTPQPATNFTNNSNWTANNESYAADPFTNTYMGMSSGSNNGTGVIGNLTNIANNYF